MHLAEYSKSISEALDGTMQLNCPLIDCSSSIYRGNGQSGLRSSTSRGFLVRVRLEDIPVGIWQHCSSPQRWQKEQDALHLSLQTLSQWLWGGGWVKGRGRNEGGEK